MSIEFELSETSSQLLRDIEEYVHGYAARRDALQLAVEHAHDYKPGYAPTSVVDAAEKFHAWLVGGDR